ncbi:COX8 domain-containing protein [Nerophis ophidion]|uniref:COX8 domain-containing protein n=1 Tax=Nerophis ophidion TaxID=159077 RepID=UPI002AE064C5|nr:COX8 domain-containing protein [Nerophis ophidion]
MMMASRILTKVNGVSKGFFCRPQNPLKDSTSMIYSKPPRNQIGALQSFFVMSVFAVAMLAPAAWILHHLPEYRQRSRQKPRT